VLSVPKNRGKLGLDTPQSIAHKPYTVKAKSYLNTQTGRSNSPVENQAALHLLREIPLENQEVN
jgi:hypothetical protein